jgi:hypothetical protein
MSNTASLPTIDLADACTVWQSGRDGGSSALRGGARVVTGIPHYFDAPYIREKTRAAADDPGIQARARLLLDAVTAAPARTARDWYEHCGLDGEPFAGRGIERKNSHGEDEQILQSLRRGWLQMPLWGFSLDRGTAERYGSASKGLMSFMFELTGPCRGIAAWESSDVKTDEREIIASAVYGVTGLEQRDSTWWVQLKEIGQLWPISGVDGNPAG